MTDELDTAPLPDPVPAAPGAAAAPEAAPADVPSFEAAPAPRPPPPWLLRPPRRQRAPASATGCWA